MRQQIVPLIGRKPPVPTEQKVGVTVSELASHDGRAVTRSQTKNCVGVPPRVEGCSGEPERVRDPLVNPERSVATHVKEQSVRGEVACVVREHFPRPQLRCSNDSVPPRGFRSTAVECPGFEVHVPAPRTFADLPFHARSGHESFDSSEGQRKPGNECLGLLTLEPDQRRGVGLRASHIGNRVVRQDFPLDQPTGKDAKSRTVTVLRGSADRKGCKELRHGLAGEPGSRERAVDESLDLLPVFPDRGPFVKQLVQVGVMLSGYEVNESVRGVGVEQLRQGDPSVEDQAQGIPMLRLAPESLGHALDLTCGLVVGSASGEGALPSIGERNPNPVNPPAFRSKRHRTVPLTVPSSKTGAVENHVSLYPGRDSNPHSRLGPEDFEFFAAQSEESPVNSSAPHHNTPQPPPDNRSDCTNSSTARRCPRCGEWKPLDAFGLRRKKGKLAPLPYCKPCHVEYHREWRASKGREKFYVAQAATRSRYPDRERARRIAREAAKRGKIQRGECCVGGDCAGGIDAHHDDYSRPLDVQWVCRKHHRALDRKRRKKRLRVDSPAFLARAGRFEVWSPVPSVPGAATNLGEGI